MSNQVPGWQQIVERIHESRRWTSMLQRYAPWYIFEVSWTFCERFQKAGNGRFAFAHQHAIDGPVGVAQNLPGD
jgi:hypothetical protein